jgi:hypothetical protein
LPARPSALRRIGSGVAVVVAAASFAAGGFAAQSPRTLLASMLGNARAQHSVHYVSRQSLGASGQVSLTADVARERGLQHVTETFGRKSWGIEIRVVRSIAYVRGGKRALAELVDLTSAQASRYAAKWISIPSADRLYAPIATAVTLGSFLRQIRPRGRLEAASTSIGGTRVIEVRGRSHDGERILVARRAGLLPLEATGIAPGGMTHTTMSRWHEAVHVRAPAKAVSIATVRG